MASNAISNTISTVTSIIPLRRNRSLSSEDGIRWVLTSSAKRLPWFGTPVDTHDGSHGHHHSHDDSNSETQSWEEKHGVEDGYPRLHKAHEAPVIQLFYDLFFVANLTTFTSVHEINDRYTLKTYVGFFAMLWFAWLQSTLFDIRFGNDSVFERVCKALQFGVMAGFAVVGPAYKAGWDIDEKEAVQALKAFQTLSIIMMISRLVLAAQYTAVLVTLREWRKTILPLALHALLMLISAAIFFGLFYSFLNATGDRAIIAWYVMIGVEAGVILLMSAHWKFLSFRKTNVVERIGLITLIVIGEGIIGLCKSIQKVGNDQDYGADIVGMIICAVVIVYCFWMLYFDQAEHEHVGTFRQIIWIMLHFPFLTAVLFTSEGVAQLSMWRKLLDFWYALTDKLTKIPMPTTNEADTLDKYVDALKNATDTWMKPFNDGMQHLKLQQPNYAAIYSQIEGLADNDLFTTNNTAWKEQLSGNVTSLFNQAAIFAAKTFNIEEPDELTHAAITEEDVLNLLIDHTFQTVFIYFFVAAGLAVVFSACLYIFGKRHKNRGDYLNLAFRFLVGTILGLLALMAVSNNGRVNDLYARYASGPWMIPTVTIMYFLVIIVHHLCMGYVRKLNARFGGEKT